MSNTETSQYPLEQLKNQTILCESWDDFRSKVSFSRPPSGSGNYIGERIFRGQAKPPPDYKLESAWQRRYAATVNFVTVTAGSGGLGYFVGDSPTAIEDYLSRFKERLDVLPANSIRKWEDAEIIALGRHHGLITTLLDWSYSPYVAAFFALEECFRILYKASATLPGNNVAIWCLLLTDELKASMEAPGSPLKLNKARGEGANRQIAQAGLFTDLRGVPDIETHLSNIGMLNHLTCYEIFPSTQGYAMRDLDLMNINFATMYPDVQGAAWQANINPQIYDFIGRDISKLHIPD